jgi:hypothetical protein
MLVFDYNFIKKMKRDRENEESERHIIIMYLDPIFFILKTTLYD